MKSYNLKMNLQLFADPSASLQNTTGTMTNEMKTFYEKRLICLLYTSPSPRD